MAQQKCLKQGLCQIDYLPCMEIDAKRITKNTLFMYFRYILILFVTFYVSRIVLDRLGADDYGLYNVVFGVVGFLSFLNGTLSSSTSRFITYELGRGNVDCLKSTFSTTLSAHVLLACIIIVVGESIGLWYATHIMSIPPERFFVAMIVYQISIITAVISIIQVPFTAVIIAHERMDAYAYIGIYDAFARFMVAFLLSYSTIDNLLLYSVLLLLVVLSVFLMYMTYSFKHFGEVRFNFILDRYILKSVIKFSGWNVLANLSQTFSVQGVILLFNVFFLPVVAAAQAIANQIYTGMFSLASNVTSSINPQIIKLYADEKQEDSRKLTQISAEFIFFLLMVLCVPCIMIMPNLLELWLIDVPEYTVIFARLILFQLVFESFNHVFYTPLLAANKIAINSITAFVICIIQFVALYAVFKSGFPPTWARYFAIIITIVLGIIVKPIILYMYIGYSLKRLYQIIGKCVTAFICSLLINYAISFCFIQGDFKGGVFVFLVSLISTTFIAILFIGSEKRRKLLRIITKMSSSFISR